MNSFDALIDYLENRMKMSHIYQPVMIRELVHRGGSATVDQIAQALLAYDPSQVEYYGLRVKNMVGKVLTANGITNSLKSGRSIKGFELLSNLTAEQAEEVIQNCDRKIEDYLKKRSEGVWSHRRQATGYISGTIRYEGRCQSKTN